MGNLSTKAGIRCSFVVQLCFNKYVGSGCQYFVRIWICNYSPCLLLIIIDPAKGCCHMQAKSRISRHGKNLTVHIPAELAREWGVQEGTVVSMTSSGRTVVLRKDPLALGKMLEQITPENLHSEHDTGVPQGREEW